MTINTTTNKRVDPDDADADADADAVKEPATKKRVTENNNIINVDDDDVDVVESPAAATTVTTTTNIVPVISLFDPTDVSYDLTVNANKGPDMNNKVTWVIYLAVDMPKASKFTVCLDKCRSIAAQISDEFNGCLQLDGTRHVTLWCGKLTKDEAREIRFVEGDDDYDDDGLIPVDVTIGGWVEKGAYLKLDDTTQEKLRTIMGKIQNLPGKKKKTKNSCDHMNLYRARRMHYKTFQTASTQIREGVPANNNEWGSIPGVTIRLKVQGSDYNHCKVLVGN